MPFGSLALKIDEILDSKHLQGLLNPGALLPQVPHHMLEAL